jgi:LuxR family maltose regulon positive regulatory protein
LDRWRDGEASSGEVSSPRLGRNGVIFRPLLFKLRPPPVRVATVQRAGVVARLLSATEPIVLVSAPAGSGKSIVLSQWAALESRPVAWLRLDASEDDPVVFLAYLAAALGGVIDLGPEDARGLVRRAPRPDSLTAAVSAVLADADPFVMVLDDCHLVRNPECWAYLALLVEQLPEGATVALATRADPPLCLGRWLAEGRLLGLRFADLAFGPEETAELLRLHGIAADDATVATLLELTEGWATGVYLGLLASRDRPARAWLAEVRGDQHAIAAYLLDEGLGRQPADLQAFLEQTSILDELTAPLCAAVTGRADAGAVLSQLASENLFVGALDDHDERFRYHHLFAELLQHRLEDRGAEEPRRLHRLAAAWYRDNHDLERAIRHYLAAGDMEVTLDLAARTVDSLLLSGRVESARSLLKLYTDEQLLSHASLAIAAGFTFALVAGTPDEQRVWGPRMNSLSFIDGPSPMGAASLRSSHLTIVAELALDGLTQMRRGFEEVLRLETEPGEWRGMANNGLARAHYLTGSPERATAVLEEVLREVPGSPDFSAEAHGWLALIGADAGRWSDVVRQMAEARLLRPAMGADDAIHHHCWLPLLLGQLRIMSHDDDPATMEHARFIERFTEDMVQIGRAHV